MSNLSSPPSVQRSFAKHIQLLVGAFILSPAVLICANAHAGSEANVLLKLSPTGSFTATTGQVIGTAHVKADGSVEALKIEIPLDTLTTGIALRDEHMKTKHLETDKFPKATVTDAKGKDGKGTANLEIRGVKKTVEGTYKIDGKELVVNFPINIADYNVGKIRYMGVGVKEEATIEARIPIEAETAATAPKKAGK